MKIEVKLDSITAYELLAYLKQNPIVPQKLSAARLGLIQIQEALEDALSKNKTQPQNGVDLCRYAEEHGLEVPEKTKNRWNELLKNGEPEQNIKNYIDAEAKKIEPVMYIKPKQPPSQDVVEKAEKFYQQMNNKAAVIKDHTQKGIEL